MKIKEYIIDETAIKAGSELTWLWVINKSLNKHILFFNISKERNMFVAERFLSMAVQDMECIQFQQTVVLGIHKPASF